MAIFGDLASTATRPPPAPTSSFTRRLEYLRGARRDARHCRAARGEVGPKGGTRGGLVSVVLLGMLVTVTRRDAPEGILIPAASIIEVNIATGRVRYHAEEAVRVGMISPTEITRLRTQRLPAPTGAMLQDELILWVDVVDDQVVYLATLSPNGEIRMHEADLKMADHDRAATEALKRALDGPPEQRRRNAPRRRRTG